MKLIYHNSININSTKLRVIYIFIILLFNIFNINAQINFPSQSSFKYLKGNNAAELPEGWMLPDFDDNNWESGIAPFWYGDGSNGTVLDDMQNSYSTVYLRSSFQCDNSEILDEIIFSVNYDDGFIVWINGEEVLSINAPASPTFNSFASEPHESGSFEQFFIDSSNIYLLDDTNYIAIQVFNINLESTDCHIDIQINAEYSLPEYPDSLNIFFSENSGFYNSPFQLNINTQDLAAKIVYTLDGSNPRNSITSFIYDSVANIYIDPKSTFGRAKTPAIIVRASVMMEGYKPSYPQSRTFIFLEDVKTQSHPGGAWPTGSVNNQTVDLDVDSIIIKHSDYSELINDAFLEISSISIITDINNLFNPITGIYVNAREDGVEWERECSVELLNPDNSEGFGVNAGLRIRGGFSRSPEFAKHSFRLLFKGEYGDTKLRFPIFGDEGVGVFDNLDLRTAQNYAWSNGDSRNTMVKEVFSRDSQRDLGQSYTRSRYYHLYLNGMYWGLYQTQERSEADYAADYFGGDSEDYDVIKVEALIYNVKATDGNMASWSSVYNKTRIGFVDNKNYFELEGKDEFGNHIKDAITWVDIDNLIDYMLTIFYAGNWDGPVSEPLQNKQPNNFYAIYSRENRSEGFRFFNHDAEHTLLGLYDNRVNIADRTDGNNMVVYEFKEFHPQWLHYKLTKNSEYRQRFADRASMHLNNALSKDETLKRFNIRVSQIDTAIIAESARWGDGRGVDPPYTRNDNWIPEITKMQDNYFPIRTGVVIDQLKLEDLYSDLNAPLVKENGNIINTSYFEFKETETIVISNPNSKGIIYYCTDGSDPRKIGGGISENANISENNDVSIVINSTIILKARIYNNGDWGSLKHVNFLKSNEDFSTLKVTELHYHPLDEIIDTDTIIGKKLEFIEFKNTGDEVLNLSGLILDSAVYYEFPENTVLSAGQFYVISSKTSAFYDHYGMKTSGNYSGYLSNSGEEVLLHDKDGNAIIHFTYDDKSPWPEEADGEGYSLVSSEHNPLGDPDYYLYWEYSLNIDGSPFSDEPYIDDINFSTLESVVDVDIYPNPTNDILNMLVNVNVNDNVKEVNVDILSITGVLLYRGTHDLKIELNLQTLNLESGMYIVKVSGNNFSVSNRVVYLGNSKNKTF